MAEEGVGGGGEEKNNNNKAEEEEEEKIRRREEESVKLFVGQVPKHMTEEELLAMFKELALVDQVNIIKDKATKASRGCCFVICPSREEADKAVNACHNKKTLSGASSPLQVKYADGELERLENKLFVGMLPKNVSEAELFNLFSKYGTIKDLQILRGSQQTSKGCAFLKYETKDQALAAVEAVNGKHVMEGSNVPLVVKWADTEKERQARRAQKAQSQGSNLPNTSSEHPSVFGALPLGYVPPYNGYGYQAPGSYGLVPYRLPSIQNQPAFHGLRYPMSYPGGMMSPLPLSSSPGSMPFAIGSNSATPSVSTSSGGQIEGPPGANLFIYHIPQEFGDQELANAFQAFGKVLSAKVFVDKVTGLSKCFGFVSFDSPAAAQDAISSMNGRQLGATHANISERKSSLSVHSRLFSILTLEFDPWKCCVKEDDRCRNWTKLSAIITACSGVRVVHLPTESDPKYGSYFAVVDGCPLSSWC